MTTAVLTGTDREGHLRQLRERLAPVFADIAASAARREAGRRIDRSAVHALRDAGFTALRVPEEYGGAGLGFAEAAGFLVDLAAADSNLAQALRAHYLHTESVLASDDPDYRDRWLRRLGSGVIVGNAVTEVGNAAGTMITRLTRNADGRTGTVKGTKFYSTGSLYADWIIVTAQDEDGNERGLAVPLDAPGLTLEDDWDGFGQQLSASGTTHFKDTPVDLAEVSRPGEGADTGSSVSSGQALAQYVHLATLAGIGQAIVRDAAEYVRGRRRSFSHGAAELPRDDPQVLQVVGEVSSAAFAAEAAFRAVVEPLGRLLEVPAGQVAEDELNGLYITVYQAQQVIATNVLDAATRWFEVGGASATSRSRALDRHWRNARVLASHNPLIYRARYIGDWEVNRTPPGRNYRVGSA
jgi:alkylation response protein AidB-like acyl-CoA dehydrogenase